MTIIAPISRIMPRDNAGTSGTGTTAGSTSNGGAGAPATAGSTELGREAFLQLLVAQLKYQDPSKPMDASEMIAQSAQLTMVDKLADISKALASQAVTQQLTLAGSIVGKDVSFTTGEGVKITAPVNSVKFVAGELVLSTPDWDIPMSSVESIGSSAAAMAAPAGGAAPTSSSGSTTGPSTGPSTGPTAGTGATTGTGPSAGAGSPVTTDPSVTTDPAATDPSVAADPATDPAIATDPATDPAAVADPADGVAAPPEPAAP